MKIGFGGFNRIPCKIMGLRQPITAFVKICGGIFSGEGQNFMVGKNPCGDNHRYMPPAFITAVTNYCLPAYRTNNLSVKAGPLHPVFSESNMQGSHRIALEVVITGFIKGHKKFHTAVFPYRPVCFPHSSAYRRFADMVVQKNGRSVVGDRKLNLRRIVILRPGYRSHAVGREFLQDTGS